ncbi:MAG: hypothetical protein PHZ23_15845 [Acidiphilium sp.]|nr:hypothetical protein [Acidiphilium sp.]
MLQYQPIDPEIDHGGPLLANFELARKARITAFFDTLKTLLEDDAIQVAQVITFMSTVKDFGTSQAERERARAEYCHRSSDSIEVDDNALSSRGEDGTWITAWIWLQDEIDQEEFEADYRAALANAP